jgi:two-component system sensor histidine kinase MprB
MTPFVRRSSFQARLSAIVAVAVGVAIAIAAVSSYFAVSHQLHSQADQTLENDLSAVSRSPYNVGSALHFLNNTSVLVGTFTKSGAIALTEPNGMANTLPQLRTTSTLASVLKDKSNSVVITDIPSNQGSFRALSVNVGPVQQGGPNNALVLASSLAPLHKTLSTLKFILFLVAMAGILLALALGWLVGATTLRPVRRLTAAAEHVAETQQLDATIEEESTDELGRLAHAFNAMLAALSASRQQQAQLVSDAGHELRTPLTSLRTNVELLVRAKNLPDGERQELTDDVTAQLEELTTLIGDLVELARQEEQQPEPTEIRLDNLVTQAVARAQRRAPSVSFEVNLTAGSVVAQPPMLERAVLNVLDNAAKWSPPGSTVEVTLTRGERWCLDIRDHGPGIAPDDLTKVFDRFYRAATARSMPGSGLGLAIVSQVVTSHGGSVVAILPPDGGTLMRIELPTVVEQEPDLPPLGGG